MVLPLISKRTSFSTWINEKSIQWWYQASGHQHPTRAVAWKYLQPRWNTWWRHPMETFSALLAFVWGIHRSPVNSPHKGQWRGALMFSLICAWTNRWVNNRMAGDLRRHQSHYDVRVMSNLINRAGLLCLAADKSLSMITIPFLPVNVIPVGVKNKTKKITDAPFIKMD